MAVTDEANNSLSEYADDKAVLGTNPVGQESSNDCAGDVEQIDDCSPNRKTSRVELWKGARKLATTWSRCRSCRRRNRK